jgi:hypothetical protein
MARWTETPQDVRRLSEISRQMPIGGNVAITLLDGRVLDGLLIRYNAGNNAGQGGWRFCGWRFYGECEIEAESRQRWVIDFLDIKSVTIQESLPSST